MHSYWILTALIFLAIIAPTMIIMALLVHYGEPRWLGIVIAGAVGLTVSALTLTSPILSALLVIAWIAVSVCVPTRRPYDEIRCIQCGYDLNQNVSGVCPECGQSIATS